MVAPHGTSHAAVVEGAAAWASGSSAMTLEQRPGGGRRRPAADCDADVMGATTAGAGRTSPNSHPSCCQRRRHTPIRGIDGDGLSTLADQAPDSSRQLGAARSQHEKSDHEEQPEFREKRTI